jgi:hypothetical protein
MHFRSLANFVGIVVGFLDVCINTPRRLRLAASSSFEIEMALIFQFNANSFYRIRFPVDRINIHDDSLHSDIVFGQVELVGHLR